MNSINSNSNVRQNIQNRLSILLKIALLLALLTVVLSSYIRHVESALGCEPWPSCYGQYHHDESVRGINVLMESSETASLRLERIAHRLIASSLGLVILLLFILSWLPSYRKQIGRVIPSSLMFLTLILALIGPIHPMRPLPILTLGNFVGGLLILVMIFYLLRRLTSGTESEIKTVFTPFVKAGIWLVALQILWGGWTSANFAGTSCERLFDCTLLPESRLEIAAAFNPVSFLKLESQYQVVVESKMEIIQLIHHLLAGFTLIYFIFIVVTLMRMAGSEGRQLSQHCMLILSLLVAQFLVGMANLIFQLPILLVLSHHFLSVVLLMIITSLHIKLSKRASG